MKTNDGMANVVSGLGAANPKVAAGQYLVTADQVGMADAAFPRPLAPRSAGLLPAMRAKP